MSEKNRKKLTRKQRREQPRQSWKPHWLPKSVYGIWCALFSVFKIAAVAMITVALVVVVCAFVLVGLLGNYLQEDILTEAVDWSMEDYDMEETSFIYHVDQGGNAAFFTEDSVEALYQALLEIM